MDWVELAKVAGPGAGLLIIVGKGLQWFVELLLGEAKEALENVKKENRQLERKNDDLEEENDALKDDVRELRAKLQAARRSS